MKESRREREREMEEREKGERERENKRKGERVVIERKSVSDRLLPTLSGYFHFT